MIEADIPDSPTRVISNAEADTDATNVEPVNVPVPLCVSNNVPNIWLLEASSTLTIATGAVCV